MTRSRYCLNSAVITAEGTYRYSLIDPDRARTWCGLGPVLCRIGYAKTCEALAKLLDIDPPEVDRRQIHTRAAGYTIAGGEDGQTDG